jgi:hypothetical protein
MWDISECRIIGEDIALSLPVVSWKRRVLHFCAKLHEAESESIPLPSVKDEASDVRDARHRIGPVTRTWAYSSRG